MKEKINGSQFSDFQALPGLTYALHRAIADITPILHEQQMTWGAIAEWYTCVGELVNNGTLFFQPETIVQFPPLPREMHGPLAANWFKDVEPEQQRSIHYSACFSGFLDKFVWLAGKKHNITLKPIFDAYMFNEYSGVQLAAIELLQTDGSMLDFPLLLPVMSQMENDKNAMNRFMEYIRCFNRCAHIVSDSMIRLSAFTTTEAWRAPDKDEAKIDVSMSVEQFIRRSKKNLKKYQSYAREQRGEKEAALGDVAFNGKWFLTEKANAKDVVGRWLPFPISWQIYFRMYGNQWEIAKQWAHDRDSEEVQRQNAVSVGELFTSSEEYGRFGGIFQFQQQVLLDELQIMASHWVQPGDEVDNEAYSIIQSVPRCNVLAIVGYAFMQQQHMNNLLSERMYI